MALFHYFKLARSQNDSDLRLEPFNIVKNNLKLLVRKTAPNRDWGRFNRVRIVFKSSPFERLKKAVKMALFYNFSKPLALKIAPNRDWSHFNRVREVLRFVNEFLLKSSY